MFRRNDNLETKYLPSYGTSGVRTLLILALIVMIEALCLGGAVDNAYADNYILTTNWGGFYKIKGILLDSTGNVYVTDNGATNYSCRFPGIMKYDTNGNYMNQVGTGGGGAGSLSSPCWSTPIYGMVVDIAGYLYVNSFNSITRFDPNGHNIGNIGSYGTGAGQYSEVDIMLVDSSGSINVYVVDQSGGNPRIQKFDTTGKFVTQVGSYGTGPGQYSHVYGMSVDIVGDLYVYDIGGIIEFNPDGTFLNNVGLAATSQGIVNGKAVFDSMGNEFVVVGDSIYKYVLATLYNSNTFTVTVTGSGNCKVSGTVTGTSDNSINCSNVGGTC
ncbi:MAG: hypothetical protein HQL03_05690 [Nitrospirae bacterium]|nr:hypothetical protein [Nitrospirota bacterium]